MSRMFRDRTVLVPSPLPFLSIKRLKTEGCIQRYTEIQSADYSESQILGRSVFEQIGYQLFLFFLYTDPTSFGQSEFLYNSFKRYTI